jgi:ATP-dependent DNA helicase RecG
VGERRDKRKRSLISVTFWMGFQLVPKSNSLSIMEGYCTKCALARRRGAIGAIGAIVLQLVHMVQYFNEEESKNLEFKSKVPKYENLIKTCVAFANGSGGQIFIGIDDESKTIIGYSESDRKKIYHDFQNSLYDSTTPSLFADIYEKNFGKESVLVIEIAHANKKPCFITKEGPTKGVYIRVGSSTRKANKDYIEELLRENSRSYYDEEIIFDKNIGLNKYLLDKFYGEQPSKRQLQSDRFMKKQAENQREFYPTIAGTLLFNTEPENYVPEAYIICTRYEGIKGRDIIQKEEITGDLQKQVNDSSGLLISWLRRNYSLVSNKLESRSIIPEEAIREAIINAIVHRKYSIPGAIKISLYDDRLEIFSPGNFPGLVDINNLGDGTTYLRNPTIAQAFRKLKLIEKLGSGIRLIYDSCFKRGLKEPTYNEDGDFVKLTFNFAPNINPQNFDEEEVLKLFKFQKELTIKDLIQNLEVSRNTATRKMNKLIEKKLVKRIGKGPLVRYILIS